MASGGHILQQQRQSLDSRIKLLVNNALKEICKAYNQPVSGNKAVLQKRCSEVLDSVVARGDVDGFNEFKYRVENHGATPPRSVYGTAPGPASQTTPGYRAPAAHSRLPVGPKYFKASPFYEMLETVLPLQDLPDMPQNRHTVRASLQLIDEVCAKLKSDSRMRLLMYCAPSQGLNQWSWVDVSFPNQLEVRINGEEVKTNFKGLKNKAGSTKPADITPFFHKSPTYNNQISVTYALTSKKYAYTIFLVRQEPVAELVRRIQNQVITKQKVLEEMNRANNDPDIAATSVVMSLKDPISTLRINVPVRSTVCSHNQCFDGRFFLELQEQAPTWQCPICNKFLSFQSLSVDKYVEEILDSTSPSTDKITVEPTGQWSAVHEGESEPKGIGNQARAPYDNDFDDDDIIDVTDQPNTRINELRSEAAISTASPFAMPSFPINTPSLSSREPSVAQSASSAPRPGSKRPAHAIIDLTLSDDEEDQLPRPAKRQTTVTNNDINSSGGTHSYNTPSSLPDLRFTGSSNLNNSSNQIALHNTPPSASGSHEVLGNRNNISFGNTTALNYGTYSSTSGQLHSQPLTGTGSGSPQRIGFSPFATQHPSQQSPPTSGMRLPPIQGYNSTSPQGGGGGGGVGGMGWRDNDYNGWAPRSSSPG